jgi:hypothetical protein
MVGSDDLELQTAGYIPAAVACHLISRCDWIPGFKCSQLGHDKFSVKSLMLSTLKMERWLSLCVHVFSSRQVMDLNTVLSLEVYTKSCHTNSVLVGIGLLKCLPS